MKRRGRDRPYASEQLDRLLSPRRVAVVGATERVGAFGQRVMANLAEFDGEIWPVNGRYASVLGRPCYPNLAALPAPPDCVFIAVPREGVEAVVGECVEAGAGGAIIVASGFAETGKRERLAEQARIVERARDGNLRLLGPNTIGYLNYTNGAGMTFSAMPERRPLLPHAIGIVSQSGSLGFSLVQAVERGTSISHVLTAGNSCDVDVADLVAYLAHDPACRAIACLFEGMAEPQRMLRAAEIAWQANKPLVIYKMATGQTGAAAAMSHTGSLAGSEAAYRAGFAAAGVIQVDRLEALVETAAFFAKAPPPTAAGVAVIATSGGATIMAADMAERHAVALPQPGPAAAAILAARVPDFGSPRNPCDVTAQAISDSAGLLACIDALLGDAAFGALVTSHAYAYESATKRLPVFSQSAARHGKITCNVWVPEWLGGPGARESEADPHIALFHSMERCFATLAAWHRRDALRRRGPEDTARLAPPEACERARALLRDAATPALSERQSKQILALYGIPVAPDRLAADPDAAVAAASAIGYPVVLKIESADILHKSDAGLVRLGLTGPEQVARACREILRDAAALATKPRIDGVSVQPLIAGGVEVLVGGRIDPQFGPLVVVGLGGILVELLGDSALALAPIGPRRARAMLAGLKGAALLRGFRGAAPVDLERLADIVARASELVADLRDDIAELDVNPLLCTGRDIVAVDGLIVKA